MAKLTKAQAKAHQEACDLLVGHAPIIDEQAEFIFEHFQESATNVNSAAGAFFTPLGLAIDFALEVSDAASILDLCAGIGMLSYAVLRRGVHRYYHGEHPHIVCVELNPEYADAGSRLVPEATWIVGSIFDPTVQAQIAARGPYVTAISNPPFGKIKGEGAPFHYSGPEFEYRVIDQASRWADYGCFILPAMSCGFKTDPYYQRDEQPKYKRFNRDTGLNLEPGAGWDCSLYLDQWHGVAPQVQIVACDFESVARQDQLAVVA